MPGEVPDSTRRFAEERSHRERASALEYTKLLIQLLVGKNGFAVTALLTLAGAMKGQTEFARYVGIPCVGYIAGVVCGVWSAFKYADSQRNYSKAWQQTSSGNIIEQESSAIKAIDIQKTADRLIIASLISFIIGSILALWIIICFSYKNS